MTSHLLICARIELLQNCLHKFENKHRIAIKSFSSCIYRISGRECLQPETLEGDLPKVVNDPGSGATGITSNTASGPRASLKRCSRSAVLSRHTWRDAASQSCEWTRTWFAVASDWIVFSRTVTLKMRQTVTVRPLATLSHNRLFQCSVPPARRFSRLPCGFSASQNGPHMFAARSRFAIGTPDAFSSLRKPK